MTLSLPILIGTLSSLSGNVALVDDRIFSPSLMMKGSTDPFPTSTF